MDTSILKINKKAQVIILLYQDRIIEGILEKINSVRNYISINKLETVDDFSNFFNHNDFINAICINDYDEPNYEELVNLNNIENKLITNTSEFYKVNEDYEISYFYTDQNIYSSIVEHINIINPNGKFHLISNSDFQKAIHDRTINENNLDEILYEKAHEEDDNGVTLKGGYDTLKRLIKFYIKNGKILFCGMKENYKTKETKFPNTKDIKTLDFIIDIKAIIRYSIVSKRLNIYKDSSLWSEHILNKVPDGITVIDEDLNIIYSNEQRRKKHKSNILGKKCSSVFNSQNFGGCNICPYKQLLNNHNIAIKSGERHTLRISDKADNVYWLLENTIIAHLKSYTKKVGILACKEINFRYEIFELAKSIQNIKNHNDVNDLIEDTFINKLGFENIRVYLNYSNTSSAINKISECDNNNSPQLVLVHSNNSIQKDKIGWRIPCEVFIQKKNENGIKCNINDLKNDPFNNIVNGKNGNYTVMSRKLMGSTEELNMLFDELSLPEKWIDIPMWDGDKLIGVLCLDYNDHIFKWDLLNSTVKKELFNGSVFLAASLNNLFTNSIYRYFHEISKEINLLDKNGGVEKQVCEILTKNLKAIDPNLYKFVEVLYYKNITKDNYKLFASSHKTYNPKEIDPTNYNIRSNSKILLNNKNGNHIIDTSILALNEDTARLFQKFDTINSICDVYLNSHSKSIGILRIIKKKQGVPLSYSDYKLLKMLSNQISELIYGYENEKLRGLLNKVLQGTTSVEISHETSILQYLRKTFRKFEGIFPKTAITVFYIVNNKLELQGYYGVKPEGEPEKTFDYNLPPNHLNNSDKKQWLIQQKEGFTPTLLYQDIEYITFNTRNDINKELTSYYNNPEIYTKFDKFFPSLKGYQSECIRQIKHVNKVVGLIRFQDENPFAYQDNQEFELFTEILSAQVGHSLILLKYIEKLKDFEESLMHEFKGPVNKAIMAISKIEKNIGLSIDNYFDNIKTHRNNNSFPISKSAFFPAFRSIRNDNILLGFVAESPYIESINWESKRRDGEFKEVCLGKIIRTTINSLRHKIDFDERYYPHQENFEKIEIDHNISAKTIIGFEYYLKLAFFNVISNAIKYTHKKDMYFDLSRKIYVKSEIENTIGKPKYKVIISNFGKTVGSHEKELVFTKKYRSLDNAINKNEGLGLGLFYSKIIFNAHNAKISMNPYPDSHKTEIIIIF